MKFMEISCSPCEQYSKPMRFDFQLQLFAGEKTEKPTGKKLSDARSKGQVAKSQELSTSVVLLIGFFALKIYGSKIYEDIATYMVYIFSHIYQPIDVEFIMRLFTGIILLLAKTAFPIMLMIMVAGIMINFFQVGFLFTTQPLEFKLSTLNPINGFGRIFSKRSLVELLKSILKICIVGIFVYRYLKDEILQMPKLISADLYATMETICQSVLTLGFKIIEVLLVLAVLDYAYQKWEHIEGLKMSKQEVKDEGKQSEGDPQIKSKIKQKQREIAMRRMMQEVPKADVIVTNPTHFAVALKYEAGMGAPVVLAKGQDVVAQKIKEIAKEHRIAIVENKPLARALYASTEIGDEVPQELYKSVAEVLAYVYRLKKKKLA